MNFIPNDKEPVYIQIIRYIKQQIVRGDLQPGDPIPSRREMAVNIKVNPNTVQKAYRELERQGYIYTTTGVGTFVSDKNKILPDPKAVTEAKDNLDDAFCQLLYLGMSHDEAKEIALDIIERRRISND